MRLVVGVIVLVLAVVIAIAAVRGTQGKLWAAVFGGAHGTTPGAGSTAPPPASATQGTTGAPVQASAQNPTGSATPQLDAAMATAQGNYALAA